MHHPVFKLSDRLVTIEIGTTLRRQRVTTSNIICPIISQLSKLTEPTKEDELQPDPP